ncbi:hypothetical protein SAMN02745883_02208 [Caminicella sporogenes DSM 14501]|uniref:Uncharacterized protein n=1 Tax=Caminicella sporogenes DSM 14501 TaxID=1121266 RepID=A0A1M6T0V4_9FIRM|nr:YeeE/YedE thiosulfate transporter family protein [Caminicella sporogenes]SHK50571.1 hypothetical protein SAMN02745883_02208 [Caminicella sporogenes DSM 14501]
MSSSRIEELKKRRREYKKKKNQVIYGLLCILIALIILIFFIYNNSLYSSFWIIGLLIGFVLQRSRFCFTASFRDPILVGSTSILKAVIVAFIISTIGFGFVQYKYLTCENINIADIPGQLSPVGIHTAIGAVLFGIGMVVSGGCASGTLMRIGEGFQLQLVVLIGFIAGTILGARDFNFWDKVVISKTSIIYFPEIIGLPMAMIIQIAVLIALYILADWYEKHNNLMSM